MINGKKAAEIAELWLKKYQKAVDEAREAVLARTHVKRWLDRLNALVERSASLGDRSISVSFDEIDHFDEYTENEISEQVVVIRYLKDLHYDVDLDLYSEGHSRITIHW